MLAIHAAVFLAVWSLCFHFGASSQGVPILWLPSTYGLVVAATLSRRDRLLGCATFFGVSFLAGWLHGEDPVIALAWSFVVALEIGLGAMVLDRFVDRSCRALGIQSSLKVLAILLFGVVPLASTILALTHHLRSGDPFVGRWVGSCNALKFTSQGEVSLSIELLARDAHQIRVGFRVRDTGVGMSEEQLQRLFKPFSQADSSNTRKYGGTGLGLVISKSLVELMGGHVGVRSMSRIGTEFFVSLPFPVGSGNEIPSPAAQGHPLHVVCLDDQSSTQASLDASASRWGWRMESVENLADLLSLLERRDAVDPFDGILVDGGISQWDDRKSIARIREICAREIPVIKMVRSMSDGPADEGIRLLDGLLVKPVTPLALLKVFKNAISHPSALPEEARSGFERIGQELKPLEKVQVLLVEDNAFNQVVATETLQTLGATVDLAEHGKLAVEKLRREPRGYDLVLMDVQMPVMDGFAATRAIRSELHLNVPVVAMTAGVLASDRAKCMESGMDDFLTKPFEVEQLVAIFRKHLKLGDTKQSKPPPPSPEQKRFDPEPLLRSLGGTADSLRVVRTLVGQFLSMADQTIQRGRESSQRGDLEEAIRAFHNLKSSSATLGAMVFSATAAEIEWGLQESEWKDHKEAMERLGRELEVVRELAQAWLAAGSDPA